jgi:hypothetical protein
MNYFTANSNMIHLDNINDKVGIGTIYSADSRMKPCTSTLENQNNDETVVLPRSSGPIENPEPNDVLSGRGGRINIHLGNVRFRDVVSSYKKQYVDVRTKKGEKANIAANIVAMIRSKGGRFLKQDDTSCYWYGMFS